MSPSGRGRLWKRAGFQGSPRRREGVSRRHGRFRRAERELHPDLAAPEGRVTDFGQRSAGAGDSDRRSGGSGHLRERATCHRELAHASSFLVARLRGAPSPLAVCGLSSEPFAAPLVGRGACPPPTSSCRALALRRLACSAFDVGYDTAASGQRESGRVHG